MQSSPTSLSSSRSSISRLATACAASAAFWAACGGGDSKSPDASPPDCGPGTAPAVGVVASSGATALTFGQLSGSFNNDCGMPSISIEGHQTDVGGTGRITLCVAQPGQLATQPQALGYALSSPVVVVDLLGDSSGCSLRADTSQPVSGTASSSGLCDGGHNAAGFALTLDGAAAMTRTCGATTDSVQLTLHGTVAVAVPQ